MNAETRRARRLLKSSAELLERSRNRPHVEVREWRSEPEKQALAPIVRKTIQQPRQSGTMDAATSKAWNDWADRRAMLACKVLATVIGDTLGKRIADLEREVAQLKGQPEPKLKAVGGRDA